MLRHARPKTLQEGSPTLCSVQHAMHLKLNVPQQLRARLARTATIQRDAAQTTVIAMAQQGYLAASPISPSLAITFNTLEHFRLLRLRKPSFSIEAFAKVLCDSYALPYRRRYRTALSDCFDVYLAILRNIDKRLKVALKRDSPEWCVHNACPACCYKLDGEQPLTFARMLALDGNNSLKRVAKFGDRNMADLREFTESDYFLSVDYVDRYKDEINTDDSDSDDDNDDDFGECTKHWKSAARDEDKKMWGIFDESGIFASACRHGFILWITDMIRSGELAKYPLAIVAKALDVLGPKLLIGYDIGCSFGGTIKRSSLGPEFRRLEYRACVNAFHGYSHSHRCQTQHHPSVIEGTGLEDLETMERIFSASNQLASITRYASRFHRRVIIDMFFKQWDEDKYANLATMLLNNYRQALKTVDEESAAVNEALKVLQCTNDDLARWQTKEAAYFATVGTEDPANAAAVEYVTLLRELRNIETQLTSSMSSFMTSIPADFTFASPATSQSTSNPIYYTEAAQTRRTETKRRLLREKWEHVLRDVIEVEVRMGIDTRWRPEMPEYVATMKYITERDYQVALEKLHGLVVQRLFELHTMNISQTAYKVRTYIAKNLQRRSKAIRSAISRYNNAAQALNPPRPALDWAKVTHYTFLDEFELLRDTRNDIRAKPWAQPLARETMKKARRVARAREEIVRCNIEVRRLHTHIVDENAALQQVMSEARSNGDAISGPLEVFCTRRKRVNARLLAVIYQIHELTGYSGTKDTGRRYGASGPPGSEASNTEASGGYLDMQNEIGEVIQGEEDDAMDDAEMAEMAKLVNFKMNIS
ncbi:hypothetical protein ONZ51_g13169 [Trametes cubensis]|uniref:CxC1-like cysteine cluster associated with KDZ transposases domain-containing protein n=1 Tax=Trametes cubensis TaxID=1111947 RepID=A0AAD7X4B3_9APHY|nr:hypothetical protein ONZ51_g13169 [Trametes cubensis]